MYSLGVKFDQWFQNPKQPITRSNNNNTIKYITVSNGAKIRVQATGPQDAKITIVFSPDPPNIIEQHQQLEQILISDQYKYRVIIFETPGMGFSSLGQGTMNIDVLAQITLDIISPIHELIAKNSKIILAYSCVNSFTALCAARKQPDSIHGLVISQCGTIHEEQLWATRVDRNHILSRPLLGQIFMRLFYRTVAHRWNNVAFPPNTSKEQIHNHDAVVQESFNQGAVFCLATHFQHVLAEPVDANFKITQPTIVLWGNGDRTHKKTNKKSIYQYVETPIEYVEIEDAGHFVDLDQPYRFIQAVEKVVQVVLGNNNKL
jgi:pimeloyl-ACP methyl ester carboxylesterase